MKPKTGWHSRLWISEALPDQPAFIDDLSDGYKQQAYGIMVEATPELIERVDAAHVRHSQELAEYIHYDAYQRLT
jgi:hypothetical protein